MRRSFISLAAKLAVACLSLAAQVQPSIDMSKCAPQAGVTKVVVQQPAILVGGGTTLVNSPLCVSLGPGIRLNMSATGGPALEVTAGIMPHQEFDVVDMSTATVTPGNATNPLPSITVTLRYLPDAFGAIDLWLKTSAGDGFDKQKVSGPSTKTITIRFVPPATPTFVIGDKLTITYWTREAA